MKKVGTKLIGLISILITESLCAGKVSPKIPAGEGAPKGDVIKETDAQARRRAQLTRLSQRTSVPTTCLV